MNVPAWALRLTIGSVSVVAAVAAVASYIHMQKLAENAGEGWRSWIVPFSVDGLLVAASMVMFVRRRAGEKAGFLPWLGVSLGLIASLAANIAVVETIEPVSLAVSGWPPLALAIAFELLIMVCRADTTPKVAKTVAEHVSEQPSEQVEQAPRTQPEQPAKPVRRPVRKLSAVKTDYSDDFRAWAAELDEPPSTYAIRQRFGCGHKTAKALLDELDTPADDKAAV